MHTIRNSILFNLFAVLATSLLLAACSASAPSKKSATTGATGMPDSETSQENYPPVKVAILLPLSGSNQDLGQSMLNAAQIALFDVAYPNFELIPGDTKGTEAGATTAAQEAISKGAQIILGPVFAHSVKAVKPIAAKANINMVSFSTDWTQAGDNNFTLGFLPFDQVNRVAQYAAAQGTKRVGIIFPQNSYGQTVAKYFTQIAPRYGFQIVATTPYQPQSSNLAPTISQFAQRGSFDAILMPAGGDDARAIGSLLSLNGLPPRKVKRIGTGLLDDPALATESNLQGALFAAAAPQNRAEFERKYLITYNEKAPRLTTLAYDATALAATLARRAAENNQNNPFTKTAITNPNGFSGVDGIFRFRSNGTSERGLSVLTYQQGGITVLDPARQTFIPNVTNPNIQKTSPPASTVQQRTMPPPSAYRQ